MREERGGGGGGGGEGGLKKGNYIVSKPGFIDFDQWQL